MNANLKRAIVGAVLLGGIALAVVYRDRLDIEAITAAFADAGPAAWIGYVLVYAVATVLFFPGSVLTLAGGALFGPVLGTILNLAGAVLGATGAFLVARYLAGDWVAAKAGPKLQGLLEGVREEGWRFVAFVRLVPVFPFNLLNYALGLTPIRLSHYVLASAVCMLPGGAAYTYLGYAGREAVAGGEDLIPKILGALALLVLVAFLPRWVKRWRARRGAAPPPSA